MTTARRPRESGALLLVAALFILVVSSFLGLVFISLFTGARIASSDAVRSEQAFFVAEGGLERATRLLLSPVLDPTGAAPDRRGRCEDVPVRLVDVPLDPGRFSAATGAPGPYRPASPLSLAAAIGSADTTITATADPSTAGYAPTGRVMIDRELVDYGGISGASFTGCRRGADGTTAAAHAAGARVGQSQCTVVSTGGVPDLATPTGRRAVSAGVQLQEGWAVGGLGLPAVNLHDVHCTSTDSCWAVGAGGAILNWNGSSWGTVASSVSDDLNGVSCAAADDCWAVGTAGGPGERPLILHWNGVEWTVQNAPLNINRNLYGVGCAGPNDCWAVGEAGGGGQRPLLLWWDGAAWTLRNNPLNINEDMADVTCVGPNDCWAVGTAGGGGQRPLSLWWNGAAWAVRNNPLNIDEDLTAVACTASNDCWAVGTAGGGATQRPLILWWNGATWATRNSSLNINEDLADVACTASNDCWAVGTAGGGATQRPLILWWNGAAWATRNSSLDLDVDLRAVAMVSSADGWAVGDGGTILRWDGASWSPWQQADAVALRWDGTSWSSAAALLPVGLVMINAVSAPSYADALTAGERVAGNATSARWNGTMWVSAPPAPPRNQHLSSVWQLSSTDGWAVGDRTGGGSNGWNFLRWGTPVPNAWNAFTVDTAPTGAENLSAVAMVSPADGWAVGDRTGNSSTGWTFLRWNAGAWSLFAVDTAPVGARNLSAVALVSSADGWAVGDRTGGGSTGWTFLRWNSPAAGAWNWFAVDTAPVGARNLNAVAMASSTEGWAVGDRTGNNTAGWTFLRWNNPVAGTWNWFAVDTAPVNAQNLNAVAFFSPNDGWAAGDAGTLLHWDGTSWTMVPSATTRDLRGLSLLGPWRDAAAGWREVYR